MRRSCRDLATSHADYGMSRTRQCRTSSSSRTSCVSRLRRCRKRNISCARRISDGRETPRKQNAFVTPWPTPTTGFLALAKIVIWYQTATSSGGLVAATVLGWRMETLLREEREMLETQLAQVQTIPQHRRHFIFFVFGLRGKRDARKRNWLRLGHLPPLLPWPQLK